MSCRSTPRPGDARPDAPPAGWAGASDPAPPLGDDDLAARLPGARTEVAELTFLDYRLAAAGPPALAGLDLARFYELGAARHEEATARQTDGWDGDSRTAWARARNAGLAARLRACAAEARADVEAEAALRRRRTEPA